MKAGWKRINLEKLCEVFTDGDWIESKDQSPTGIRLIQTGNVGNGIFKDRAEKARYISEDTFWRLRCTEIVEGDCLVSRLPDPVARSCLIPSLSEKCITAVDCTIIRFDRSKIIPELFNYFSQSREYAAAVAGSVGGATRQRISRKNLGLLAIPVPPVDEQRQIVAVLNKAFAGIATAAANAQKNLNDTRALFDAYLETIFNKRGADWRDITLGDACKVERGSSPRPIKSFVTTNDDGLNWVKIGDTKNDSKYVTQTAQRITPAGALKSRKVEPGDFILTNSMSFGKPYIMKISGYIHDGWFALRLGAHTDTEYFYYLLSSPVVQKQFQNLAAGAIVLNISGDLVKKAILPLPPVEQQRELVKLIQIQDNKTKQLKAMYERKIGALSELKQSLLQKAFAGELT